MKYDVYGIGNALVDILAHVDDGLLARVLAHPEPAKAGHTKGSMTLVSREFQSHVLSLLKDKSIHTASGGSGANTVIGTAHLGGRAKYAGKVGGDPHGEFYAGDMHEAGVHFDVPFHSEATGTCVILITPDSQRTFLTHLGCSTALTPDDVDEEAVKGSRWVYIEGYLWDIPGPRAAAMKMIEVAHANNVKVACTFSDTFCVKRSLDHLREVTKKYADFVFCNEEEALVFTGADDVDGAISAIGKLRTGVAVTRGAKGSVLVQDGERHEIPAMSVNALDTTGAGDIYAAGVLYGLCSGKGLRVSGELGSRVAAQVVTVRGARLPHLPPA